MIGKFVKLVNPTGEANAKYTLKCGFVRAADSTAHACLLNNLILH